jgi:hypothetical protein
MFGSTFATPVPLVKGGKGGRKWLGLAPPLQRQYLWSKVDLHINQVHEFEQ